MYIFAPGVGCTGPTKLVKPGDEIIFNSSYNQSDWAMETATGSTDKETGIVHTCPGRQASLNCDFKPPLLEK